MQPLFLALAFSGSLFATSLNVFSTGVDTLHAPLTLPNLQNGPRLLDTHWALISGPGSANTLVTDWTSPYASEVPLSARWISPASRAGGGFFLREYDIGSYVLEQTFSLAGLLASTATLSGVFAADNCATITLNSTLLARTGGSGTCPTFGNSGLNLTTLTTFSAGPSAFVAGQNVLRVELLNESGDVGFLVNFSGASADPDLGVPEPATFVLIGSALVILAIRRSKT